jgi:2-dehydro-3-deoxyphosphogluconate aldolase/(4S)-4-hydroxy-2-oxoglutarate aldolase
LTIAITRAKKKGGSMDCPRRRAIFIIAQNPTLRKPSHQVLQKFFLPLTLDIDKNIRYNKCNSMFPLSENDRIFHYSIEVFMETLERITHAGLIPLLSPKKPELALPLLAALCSGGISAAEFSMEIPFTPDALRNGSRLFPDLLLGAGGISTIADARLALDSGARYLTTSGYSSAIAALCKDRDALYLPQCTTPSELLSASLDGLSVVGLFAPHLWASEALVNELINAFPKLKIIACRVPCKAAPELLSHPRISTCTLIGLGSDSPDQLASVCRQLTLETEGYKG